MSSSAIQPLEPSNGVPGDPESRKSDILQLFEDSRKYMEANYWDELAEVYRAVKCRTVPVMVRDKNGNKVEDKNRTNVCMPELALIVKRKTARLTANPPDLHYIVNGDDPNLLAERLSRRALYEYDKSGEVIEFRRGVQQAMTFGFNYFKTWYDSINYNRPVRRSRANMKDRAQLMQLQGHPQESIDLAVQQQGPQLSDDEIAQSIATDGPKVSGYSQTTRYEGPITKCKFIGDVFLESGCLSLNDSGYVIERGTQTDRWLADMAKKTYVDEESKKEVKVFDPEKVEELATAQSKLPQDRLFDLKRNLRDAIQQTSPRIEKRLLPGKRFEIMEFHAPDKYGRMWIEYLGNDSIYLGKQPYAWDLNGRFCYTEFVPWPDLIGAIGDSSPRLLRFLHAMHNAAVGQRQDLISQILRRTYMVEREEDIPDEVIDRKLGRIWIVKNLNGFKVQEEPDVPQSAWQTEAQIMQQMSILEPSLGNTESGTDANPQAGKTATTALIAAKSSDALTQLELDSLNICIKELAEKKLAMHQQVADDPIAVPGKYAQTPKLQEMFGNSPVTIDPDEINAQDIEVEPEAGSTLAVDDELRKNSIVQAYQMAEQDPVLWNKAYMAKMVAGTMRGIDPAQALNPPAPPEPPAPKISASINIPLDKMPADIVNQLLPLIGLQPSQDLVAQDSAKAIQHLSSAADAAANLQSPARPDPLVKDTQNLNKRINATPGA